ncbi:hypothetical protein GCM10010515_32650 [Streptomyces fructofermentans]|uniref:Uncharacterized protein n=1 Tax=Streptomyces fructofermentans TaxID=152141 RepID=A0A918KII1_9ACTN|nr:hypothetical protein GCM10010515_32650 [Streptomyces fructofermentans]
MGAFSAAGADSVRVDSAADAAGTRLLVGSTRAAATSSAHILPLERELCLFIESFLVERGIGAGPERGGHD